MKHLKNMHATFPLLPSRGAIMGVATFNAPPTQQRLDEEAAEEARRTRKKHVTVRVACLVRPELTVSHNAVVSVGLNTRISDVLQEAWDDFSAVREKRGWLMGPLPSDKVSDYRLCRYTDGVVGDELPGKALVSRVLTVPTTNSLAVSAAAENTLALVLQAVYTATEQLVAVERKTRDASWRVFAESLDLLLCFEMDRRELALGREQTRMEQSASRLEMCDAEANSRHDVETRWGTAWHAMHDTFRRRYEELEHAMVAQYTHMAALRQRHRAVMEEQRRAKAASAAAAAAAAAAPSSPADASDGGTAAA